MPVICCSESCDQSAILKRPKTGHAMCKECFLVAFETEVHVTIIKGKLFKRGDKVAIGASGGKDSTVLAYILKLLNERYDYGLDLFLLSIDEGITGYRDDSLETVKQNRDDYQLPLKILSYKDLYGWTMDEIVAQIGRKNNCTFCGVFRRQALDRGAALIGADMIVTGHNADDMAETIIMNVLRGDCARLIRCTNIITEGEGTIPRCKPLKYAYEKEIVMYAHYKKLVYFSTECIYSPDAYRGHTREFIKEIERVRPSCILDIIYSGEISQPNESVQFPPRRRCTRCGFVASQEICKACVLLEGLNRGMPKLGIGKSNKAKKVMGLHVPDGSENKSKEKEVPKMPSKKKIRRENKKKATCENNCGTSCKSRMKKDKISKEDEEVDLTFLSIQETSTFDEETACGGAIDYSDSVTSTALNDQESIESESSDDENPLHVMEEKKEKIICKCPPMLKAKFNDVCAESDSEADTDTNSDNDLFDIEAFRILLENVEPQTSKAKCTKLSETQSKKQLNKTDTNELEKIGTEYHGPGSSSVNNLNKFDKEKEFDSYKVGSQSTTLADTSNEALQQPTIIKASANNKIRPSLLLPEMMYKTKNNLDF